AVTLLTAFIAALRSILSRESWGVFTTFERMAATNVPHAIRKPQTACHCRFSGTLNCAIIGHAKTAIGKAKRPEQTNAIKAALGTARASASRFPRAYSSEANFVDAIPMPKSAKEK